MDEGERAVVLHSGGFDSVVLTEYLARVEGMRNLLPLHFLYGARNEGQQLRCAKRQCERLGLPLKVLQLPPFDWTSGGFYDETDTSLGGSYLEYRNLVFLSYAASYAQAKGAGKVLLALVDNGADYADASPGFLEGLNAALGGGVQVYAPFLWDTKRRLGHIARYLGIGGGDYFSCDSPLADGKPCGRCPCCHDLAWVKKVCEMP